MLKWKYQPQGVDAGEDFFFIQEVRIEISCIGKSGYSHNTKSLDEEPISMYLIHQVNPCFKARC